MSEPVELTCFPTSSSPPPVVPAPLEREWMDRTSGSAYRCLPLNIANAHGWMILNEAPFCASWDDTDSTEAITLARTAGTPGRLLASSHFGYGVLTFSVRGLFRTSPGYDLWVTGPVNTCKDAIQPLSAVVETDWSPATFTMNWRFTRAHTQVSFEADEPFCMVFPMQRGLVERVEPRMWPLNEEKELAAAYETGAKTGGHSIATCVSPAPLSRRRNGSGGTCGVTSPGGRAHLPITGPDCGSSPFVD
jgi:hypothetical protein